MLTPTLTDVTTIKHLLHQKDIRPSRLSGQNFLICPEVVEATLMALTGGSQQITELGAGIGTVTHALAAAGYTVRAIERDRRLADILRKALPPAERKRTDIVVKDLRETAWQWLDAYQLVGNIPYNLSGLIIRQLTQLDAAPERVVLLVQKEVGQRMMATVPDMNLLGLTVQLWAEVHQLIEVPPSCFWPQPKVHSALMMLIPKQGGTLETKYREQILTTAKSFFQAKRKQIAGTLRRHFKLGDEQVEAVLTVAGLEAHQRPQELTPDQWQKLAFEMEKIA